MKHKKGLINALLLLGLLGVTSVVILQSNDIAAVISAIVSVHPLWIILAASLALACVALEGAIIWYLLKSVQAPSKLKTCVKWSFVGFFLVASPHRQRADNPLRYIKCARMA